MNSIRKSLIRGAAGMAVTMMPAMLFAQADADSAGAPPELTVRELAFMLRQQEQRFSDRFEQQEKALASQQKLIDGQQAALAAQEATIKSLQERFASAGTATSRAQSPGAEQRRELESQRQALATQTAAIQSLQAQVDQLNRSQQQACRTTTGNSGHAWRHSKAP